MNGSNEWEISEVGIEGLAWFCDFSPEHRALIRSHQAAMVNHQRGDVLVSADARSMRFLLGGWGARVRRLGDGRRQIFGFLVPGDLIDLTPAHPAQVCEVVAMTTGATTRIESLRNLLADGDPEYEPIARSLGQAGRVAETYLLDHLVRLGAYSAYQATAHLLLELHERLQRVGMVREGLFALPIGQRTLATALGLSPVHLNRVFKQLRLSGHLEHAAGWIALRDTDRLGLAVDFAAVLRDSGTQTTP